MCGMDEQTVIRFKRAGPNVVLVGSPRLQGRHLGIPEGGPVDPQSAALANTLTGNTKESSVIEISLLGPVIEFAGAACHIALTGADFRATLDGVPIPTYRTVKVMPGSVLKMKSPAHGCRAYLAVGGQWDVPKWMGSATYLSPGLTPRSEIRSGSEIKVLPVTLQEGSNGHIPQIPDSISVRFSPGPDLHLFTSLQVELLSKSELIVSPSSNRQGLRFKTANAGLTHDHQIISSGVFPGVIQLTPDGHLIILMVDSQTTGGYPRVGVVNPADLSLLGQASAGMVVDLTMTDLNS